MPGPWARHVRLARPPVSRKDRAGRGGPRPRSVVPLKTTLLRSRSSTPRKDPRQAPAICSHPRTALHARPAPGPAGQLFTSAEGEQRGCQRKQTSSGSVFALQCFLLLCAGKRRFQFLTRPSARDRGGSHAGRRALGRQRPCRRRCYTLGELGTRDPACRAGLV